MIAVMVDIDAPVVIDELNGFCPGGSLPVPHGDEVLPILNAPGSRFRHLLR